MSELDLYADQVIGPDQMSTNRRRALIPEDKLPKGPNGWKLCRQCSVEVKPPKRTFCSQKCVSDYKLASDASYLRRKVHQRDKGICRVCHANTDTVKAALVELDRWTYTDHTEQGGRDRMIGLVGPLKELRKALGIYMANRSSLWDADHIKEVVNGGGECGLDNMQTLCIWCHKEKTSGLATKRAAERKAARDRAMGIQPLPGVGA